MPRDKPITDWKRKKVEVETRIKELERIRSETVSWLEKASSNRTEMLWRRTEYFKFLQKQQRLDTVIRDTATKLALAKQELGEIHEQISRLEQQRVRFIPIVAVLGIILLLGLGALFTGVGSGSEITGLVISDVVVGVDVERGIIEADNFAVSSIIDLNKTEEIIQGYAKIGKPVLWKKKIQSHENTSAISTFLPRDSSNITIYKLRDGIAEEISSDKITKKLPQEDEIAVQDGREDEIEWIIEEPLEGAGTEIEVEYYTEGPIATEESTSRGKRIVVSGNEKLHYQNVTAFTALDEELMARNTSTVKIYWVEEKIFIQPTAVEDQDHDGIYDYLEWVVPHLSTQTFEIIIITQAAHLDANREFISDIYETVKELDGVWSEEISDEHYVRITFERELTSANDITIYPRIISGNPSIKVYEQNGTELIAEFASLTSDQYHKIFLTSLSGSQDTFDLRIVNGSAEFEHIIDPPDFTDCSGAFCILVFNTTGTTTWQVPEGVENITGLVIGGGGGGSTTSSAGGGANGGALRNASGINVTPGEILTITVGRGGGPALVGTTGGYSNITNSTSSTLLLASGGGGGTVASPRPNNGTSTTLSAVVTGGNGGYGGNGTGSATAGGGGGAGGYSGDGGDGGDAGGANNGINGAGGGGGGGGAGGSADLAGAGGGVGINGQGSNGAGGAGSTVDGEPGLGGSGGNAGTAAAAVPNLGGKYGGGAAGDDNAGEAGTGGQGVVVIKYLQVVAADSTAPTITINNPATNNTNYSTANILFNATISDAAIGAVNFSFNNETGIDFNISIGNYSGLYNTTLSANSFVEGRHLWQIFATDTAGNSNTSMMINFTIDRTSPNVTINTLNTNTMFNGSNYSVRSGNVTFNASIFDALTSVDRVYFWLDNGTGNDINITGVNNSGQWTISYNVSSLAEGRQGVRIIANDTVNNVNDTYFMNFTVDFTAPNVTNMTPALNSAFDIGSAIEISANITDSLVISNVFANITLPNNSIQLLQLTASTFPNKFNVSYTIPLRAGVYNITFIANDTVNNINATGFTNFTAQNTAPVVNFVAAVSPQSITEATISNFSIEFNVTDINGVADLNNNSAQIRINLTGEAERYNTSCSPKLQTSSTSISYICNISIWYFDGAGNWTINASINDTAGAYAENRSTNFQVKSTTAMNMYPTALTWATLELGTTNRTSNNDPLIINNTGNTDIVVGGITVTGNDLYGLTTITDFIGAGNFSIHAVNGSADCTGAGCLECAGTLMVNNTATGITTANITAGNNSINDGTGTSGQEQLYMCLRLVPMTLSRQTYDTSGAYTDPWTISVS